jgi:uncharacterized YccA/Bax inhibitor family protein
MQMEYKTGNPGLNDRTFAAVPRPALGEERMTLRGTVNKSFVMLTVLLLAALWPWARFFAASGDPAAVLGLMTAGLVGGFILALIISFKQTTAPYLALPYAALEGLAIGGISAIFERRYPGIAIQAVALTFAVMAVLLVAYNSGLIKVTEHFKAVVVGATFGIALLYLVSFILGFFHIQVPFLNDASPLGIIVSLAIIVVAALNLVMDFDFIQSGVERGAPRYMEWYSAFALMVTLVWLYLEILRFLAKTRQR